MLLPINGKLENAQHYPVKMELLVTLLENFDEKAKEDSEQILNLSSLTLNLHFNLLLELGLVRKLRYRDEIIGHEITENGKDFLKEFGQQKNNDRFY
ncbi:MAG: hypothetical protein QG670_2354 [Thermoproteota archaeon]|nr:hypothetical protein [Thermoproteota archaeon]